MPIGFKNGTDGSLVQQLMNAISFKISSFFRLMIMECFIVNTTGNPDGHIVLRGVQRQI